MMRAKFMVLGVEQTKDQEGKVYREKVTMQPVTGKDPFPASGESDDNTYALWTPAGALWLSISNPALFGKFIYGQKFYADFTEADT